MNCLGVAALLALGACGAAADDLADGVLVLPPQLREVSAIAAVDERTVACVQDEVGALFFVDLLGELPLRVAVFGERGDYEGLARVGDDYWVLRSDGFLMRLESRGGALRIVASFRLPAEHQEFEGLCHDADRQQLLVLPKDRAGDGKHERHRRVILAFDLATGKLRAEPEVELGLKTIVEQAELRGIELPTRTTPKGKERIDLKLLGSEILVVPGSQDLLLLSSIDHVLLRIDRTGRLLGARLLPTIELPQPEGMTFLPDGRLLVASEGVGGAAVLRVVPSR